MKGIKVSVALVEMCPTTGANQEINSAHEVVDLSLATMLAGGLLKMVLAAAETCLDVIAREALPTEEEL